MLAPVISWYFRQRYEALISNANQAIRKQEDVFWDLLEKGQDTEYGQKYDFKNIQNYEQFRQQVPIVEYEDLQPYIERTMQGEQRLLWPGEIRWFAKSSGTTSNSSKFIPISFESLEDTHYSGGRDILSVYCGQFPETKIFQGKGLLIGGSHKINQLNTRAFYGDLSAVLMNHLPVWANIKSTPDMSIALMENWEEKVESMAKATMHENVTSISGVPTWTLVLFKRLLELTGKKTIAEVWPNLELYIHGGVSFVPYRAQFEALVGNPNMNFLETYNASEGFFGIQVEPDNHDLWLLPNSGVYYEFLPIHGSNESCVPLSEVELDKQYAMVISTNCGLWRYKIGDTVAFTAKYPFKFRITGRTKLYINAFGEELVIENADKAISEASIKANCVVSDYTAAPVYMTSEKPGHQWLVEFESQPEQLDVFINELDQSLKNCNSDYEAKRKNNMAIFPPDVVVLPAGTFEKWLKTKGKLGGQNKIPRLSNNRLIVEEILAHLSANQISG